mmetsp:Transcript_43526/g.142812  ORF Transcript_43526/g.142812 Transcript_43526/m.142812 type:complete len:399 (+) Transcript_43526:224-1420(+)
MLLRRLRRGRRLHRVHRGRRLASSAVARGGCRRRAAAAEEAPAATLGDAGREAAHACDAARPSGSRAEVLCQKRERHRVVAPREARAREVLVESVGDELLRGDFEKPREEAAAEVRVVLVRHDDLQPVLARLFDLLGQPRVADKAVLVEVEQHVRRWPGRLGGGDGETGKRGGDLFSQELCTRVGRRSPEHGVLGKGERLALGLARHAEREGGLVQVVGRAEEHRLDDCLERDALELLDSHVDGVRPALFKDVGLQVLGALVAQRLQRRAALCRVRLLDEDDRLALLERRADLAEAVLGAEVATREEEEDDLRVLDVLLQRPNILEIIYVEKDLEARHQKLELALDVSDGVLTGRPDVREEEVPREVSPDAQLGGLLGRDETDRGDLGDAAGGDDGAD